MQVLYSTYRKIKYLIAHYISCSTLYLGLLHLSHIKLELLELFLILGLVLQQAGVLLLSGLKLLQLFVHGGQLPLVLYFNLLCLLLRTRLH